MKTDEMIIPEEIYLLEERLKNTLRPIKPDPQFITKMQSRIKRTNEISIDRQKKGVILLILSAGLFLGTAILFLLKQED